MQIYMAAWWHTGNGPGTRVTNIHQRNLQEVRYPYHLESFHYMDQSIIAQAKASGAKFFIDSGAFSAMTQGIKIDIKKYASFIRYYESMLSIASNLDDTSRNEALSYSNQKTLEDLGCKVQPVFHCREDDKWLKKYLDEGYDYIFIGGMVPETTKWLHGWLDHIWHHYLTNPDGTARIKVHGFGLTSLPLMFKYPWYSVDSTTWRAQAAFGGVFLEFEQPDGSIRDYTIDFSQSSPQRYNLNGWHFNSLPDIMRRAVMARLDKMESDRPKNPDIENRVAAMMGCQQGFYPEALSKSYGWRFYANLEYFRRAMNRRVDRFTRQQDSIWDHV